MTTQQDPQLVDSPDHHEQRVHALMTLFPPNPFRHNRVKNYIGGDKVIPEHRRRASNADYLAHLKLPPSDDPTGALGFPPGVLIGEKQWGTTFAVLDLDDAKPEDLQSLVNTIEGCNLHPYLTRGSTGRGSHVYLFFDESIPVPTVFSLLQHVSEMAADLGIQRCELRPSKACGRSAVILLPYRGAAEDGVGFNPLLKLTSQEFEPVPLDEAAQVVRASREQVERVIDELTAYDNVLTLPPSAPVNRPAEHSQSLEEELERLRPHWKRGNRQYLVLGLSAFALVKLGVDPTTLWLDLEKFLHRMGDEEVGQRLRGMHRTVDLHRQGRRVAWHPFYQRASVPPPTTGGASPEVQREVEKMQRRIGDGTWKGTSGKIERSIMTALLELASVHGTSYREGIAVSVSIRDLALRANVSDKGCQNGLARLKSARLVRRDRTVRRRLTEAGTLVVLYDGVYKLPHSTQGEGGLKECSSLYTHPAFRHGCLGKTGPEVLEAVLKCERRPLTRENIAKCVGKKARDIRRPLERLVKFEVLIESEARYTLPDNWEHRLDEAAVTSGAIKRRMNQDQQHDLHREAHRAGLEHNRAKRSERQRQRGGVSPKAA